MLTSMNLIMLKIEKAVQTVRTTPGGQASLARQTGYHRAAISRILAGERIPSLDGAIRIAKALGSTLDAFVRWFARQRAIAGEKWDVSLRSESSE